MPSAPMSVVITGNPKPADNKILNLIPAPCINGNTASSFFKISSSIESTNPVICILLDSKDFNSSFGYAPMIFNFTFNSFGKSWTM